MPDRMFDYHSHTKPVSDILSRGEPQKSSFQNAFSNKYEFKAKREKGPHRFLDPDILTCEEVVNLLTLNEKESSNVLSSIAQERAIDIISKRLPTQKEKQEIQEQVYDWLEKVEADPQLTRQAIHEEVEKTDREVEEFMKANSELIAKANSTIMEIVKKYNISINEEDFRRIYFISRWRHRAIKLKTGQPPEPVYMALGEHEPVFEYLYINPLFNSRVLETMDTYIHEFFHRLEVQEFWEVIDQVSNTSGIFPKRGGLYFNDPRFGEFFHDLNEAVVRKVATEASLLLRQSVEDGTCSIHSDSGSADKSMEYMAREVSWETFINAVYQPGAFRNLYMAFEKKFGRFSLFVFAKIIKDPEKVKLFIENFSYRSLFLKNEALRIENIREQSVTSFQDKG